MISKYYYYYYIFVNLFTGYIAFIKESLDYKFTLMQNLTSKFLEATKFLTKYNVNKCVSNKQNIVQLSKLKNI